MRIFSVVLNNFQNDTRVLKEARSIEKIMNSEVTILALHKDDLSFEDKVGQQSKVLRIPLILNIKYLPTSVRHLVAYVEWALKIFLIVKPWFTTAIVHVHDLKPLPIGVLLKVFSLGRIRIIYDCHEYETEVQGYNGKPKLKKLAKFIEKKCLKFVDEVICVTDSIAEAYRTDYNIRKPWLVMNCPYYRATLENKNIFRRKFSIGEHQKIFLYQGGIVPGRGVEETLEAFKRLDDSYVIIFLGYGSLVERVKDEARTNGRVFYHEAVSSDILLDYTASADYGICFAPNICKSYDFSLSNKIFEYIQAKLPMVVSPLFEFKKLVENEQIGIAALDDQADSIVESLKAISLVRMDKYLKNLERVSELYCWEEQEKVLRDIYTKYDH